MQGKYGMQGITELFHPLAMKSFIGCSQTAKSCDKIQGISLWYLQNTACTNFATEKVNVLASPGKGINEEVGIRTIQRKIRKGGCKAVPAKTSCDDHLSDGEGQRGIASGQRKEKVGAARTKSHLT